MRLVTINAEIEIGDDLVAFVVASEEESQENLSVTINKSKIYQLKKINLLHTPHKNDSLFLTCTFTCPPSCFSALF